jgi:hypothetical protein
MRGETLVDDGLPSGSEKGTVQGTMDLQGKGVYRQHRIHTTQLFSGVWVAAVVRLGADPPPGERSAGPSVEHLRGEHSSEGEAIAAARDYIDQQPEDTTPTTASGQRNPHPARRPEGERDLFDPQRGGTGT